MLGDKLFPDIDDELVKLRGAKVLDMGHLKLATWGTKEQLKRFAEDGIDEFKRD